MRYISTRGQVTPVSFQDAVIAGLAADKGLFVSENIVNVKDKLSQWQSLKFSELAYEVISLYATDIPATDLKMIINDSYATFDDCQVTPVVKLDKINILELFHGPTLAFKDIALQFIGNLYDYILDKKNIKLNILGATSGDTGSAAIEGVRNKNNINIFVMHPKGRTSPLQELQMTSVLDKNVYNIALEGSFDDCQNIMKDIFGELDFKKQYNLGSVNSINWARIVSQITYYFYAYFRSVDKLDKKINFSVPTGNFGNIFAGFMAQKMGLPINKFLLATNENKILADFFNSGIYKKNDVHHTISPSMDIQVASNFERYLFFYCQKDSQKLIEIMKEFKKKGCVTLPFDGDIFDANFQSFTCNQVDTLEVIKKYYIEEQYLLDPHTATGVYAAENFNGKHRTICLATAHPSKFPQTIEKAIGKDIAKHTTLEKIKNAKTRCVTIAADKELIKEYILKNI